MKGYLIGIYLIASISLVCLLTADFPNCRYGNYSAAVTKNRVKAKEEPSISHILFGIAGSAKTWNNRSRYSKLWWKPNVTRGFVWLDERPQRNEPWPETTPPYRVSQDTSAFKYNCSVGDRLAVRIARIVKESFELGLKNVRWFVLGDDDTVFFTENLVTILAKYDHNQMYYIGAHSESVEANMIFSYNMAYGGGGIAISYPLAKELVKILDGCINRYDYLCNSDQKIGGCMAEIGIPLTNEPGFHQMDIQGSLKELLAAHPQVPLVSLHHLDWNLVDPLIPSLSRVESVKRVIEAYKKDPGRIVQHSLCYDLKRNWSLSVSWGYTTRLYPWLMNVKELVTPMQTFHTLLGSQEPFMFNTRPYDADSCKRPMEYYLDHVVEHLNIGETMTSYKRIDDSNTQCQNERYIPALAIKIINVTAPISSRHVWRQAPRRQCCEVINDDIGTGTVLHIRIRGCNRWESATPPFSDKYGDFAYIQRLVR